MLVLNIPSQFQKKIFQEKLFKSKTADQQAELESTYNSIEFD